MLNLERLEYILKEIQEKKTVYVDQLAQQYYVSPSTIRRDLSAIEKEGLIRRSYGGAVLIEKQSSEIPFVLRKNENQEAKDIICELAANLIKDEMYIFLDTTTTVANMVQYMDKKNNLKILTTSAQIAMDCLDHLNAQIYCTGGWMSTISRGFTGETARSSIDNFYTDLLFFSVRSLSLDKELADVNEEDIYLKQTMLKNCRKSVLLADSSKFDKDSYRKVCGFDQIDYLFTDKKPEEKWILAMEKANVCLLYPGKSQ
jgi:DeoR/GlpR family transcriptional regulator of sugar metabolism